MNYFIFAPALVLWVLTEGESKKSKKYFLQIKKKFLPLQPLKKSVKVL